ncbi:MAG: hypothetical protein H7Y38_05790 [Armatimonadetes bacterium]|nr:hypothetical protein [Armatimonadota bacterium]
MIYTSRRSLLAALLLLATVGVAVPPAHAEMTGEQKDKFRAAMPMPRGSFGANFSFSRKKGVLVVFSNQPETQMLQGRLAFLLRYGKPTNDAEGLAYLRKVGDLQSVLEDKKADATYDKGEKLALALAKTAKPGREQARYLALAAAFCIEQKEYDAATELVASAHKLAPDLWEAWDAEASLLQDNKLLSAMGLSSFDADAVGNWLATKPAPEAAATALQIITRIAEARDKAVALHEKSVADPAKRDPGLYLARSVSRATMDTMRDLLAAKDPVASTEYQTRTQKAMFSGESRRDLTTAFACYSNDPYMFGARMFLQGIGSDMQAQAKELSQSLDAWERKTTKPPVESRLRVYELRCLAYMFTEKWDEMLATSEAGLKLTPIREPLRAFHMIALGKKEKFAAAERFLEDPQAATANAKPFFRRSLASLKGKLKDYAGAERILAELAEASDAPVVDAISLLTVRLKATKDDTSNEEWAKISDQIDKLQEKDEGFERDDKIALAIAVAAYNALIGYPDRARSALDELLKADEDNDAVKQMLAALP